MVKKYFSLSSFLLHPFVCPSERQGDHLCPSASVLTVDTVTWREESSSLGQGVDSHLGMQPGCLLALWKGSCGSAHHKHPACGWWDHRGSQSEELGVLVGSLWITKKKWSTHPTYFLAMQVIRKESKTQRTSGGSVCVCVCARVSVCLKFLCISYNSYKMKSFKVYF